MNRLIDLVYLNIRFGKKNRIIEIWGYVRWLKKEKLGNKYINREMWEIGNFGTVVTQKVFNKFELFQ